jgi:hypothetical protein
VPLIANKIFYIHIPKTSGTSLYANLLRQNINIEGYFDRNTFTGISYHHYHLDILPKKYNKYKKFTIVREPWSRTLSAYFYRNQKQTSFNIEHFNKWLMIAFLRFDQNKSTWDNHFRPQVEFIDQSVKIFLFDHLNQCYDWVCDELNITNNFSAHKLKNKVTLDQSTPKEVLCASLYQKWCEIYNKDVELYKSLTT